MVSEQILISGISGQMGSEMAHNLLAEGKKVIGVVRRSSTSNLERISDLLNHKNLLLLTGDITDADFISRTFFEYKPDICFWCAAQSQVHVSFAEPTHTWNVTGQSVIHALESIRTFSPKTKFIQCSSSEMFGKNYDEDENGKYQDENTKMIPASPYAVAKLAAYNAVRLYRQSYDIFASNIIMFNAEGKFRGKDFVTRKISCYVAKLNLARYHGMQIEKLKLGNLDSYRDWGAASDYIHAYKLAANHSVPDDFVICTGETHSIREFLTEAFSLIDINNWEPFVEIDESLKRPSEVPYLCGRYDKAKRILGWEPKVKFKELVRIMVEADVERLKK